MLSMDRACGMSGHTIEMVTVLPLTHILLVQYGLVHRLIQGHYSQAGTL